ncbi:MAG: BatD family protein [Opitutales bacterium]
MIFRIQRLQNGRRTLLLLAALCLAVGMLPAREPEFTLNAQATFAPASVADGQSSRYTIRIEAELTSGTFTSRPGITGVLPDVPGLELEARPQSTSQNITIINGRQRRLFTMTLPFAALAEEPGTYTVPAFTIRFGGKDVTIPEATLTVTEAAERPDRDRDPLFLDLAIPRQNAYLGQAIKATLQLYVASAVPDVRPGGVEKRGDAFSEGQRVNEFIRSRTRQGEIDYEVFAYPVLLTPLKTGEQTVQYAMRAEALLPTSGNLNNQRNRSGSPFNDPFFRRFGLQFNPDMQYQRLELQTPEHRLEILPLPEDNRPAVFSGAIGRFSLKAFPDTNEVQVGDPVTLTLSVVGRGNFDRIAPPPVAAKNDAWQVFDPETTFDATDPLGYSGEKRFIFTLIPREAGTTELPPVEFAYFDPDTESYETLSTGPIPVRVRANPGFTPETTGSETQTLAKTDPEELPGLQPLAGLGPSVGSLRPLFRQGWFLWAQALPALALLAAAGWRRYHFKLTRDIAWLRRRLAQRTLRQVRRDIDRAAREKNSRDLMAAGQRGIRACLSQQVGDRAYALTTDEVLAQLEGLKIPEGDRAAVAAFLGQVDEAWYAGRTFEEDLPDARQLLARLRSLQKLTA